MNPLYAGIEAGGTKFVVAVGAGPNDLQAETQEPIHQMASDEAAGSGHPDFSIMVGSLRTSPSWITPQCPWSVYSHRQTSVVTTIPGTSRLIALTAF